jgi:hypothetical protein
VRARLIRRAVSRVTSSGVPSSWSTSTWNSLLLSKGSIFTFTKPSATIPIDARSTATMPAKKPQRSDGLAMRAVMARR